LATRRNLGSSLSHRYAKQTAHTGHAPLVLPIFYQII